MNQERLRERRLQLHLTQQEMADSAGIRLQQYQRIENGERDIEKAPFSVALLLIDKLRLDPHVFLPGHREPNTEREELMGLIALLMDSEVTALLGVAKILYSRE